MYLSSRGNVGGDEFELRFLEDVRAHLGAEGVAVWFDPGGQSLFLRHQRRFPAAELQRELTDWQRHGRLLRMIAAQGQPRIIQPGWLEQDAGNSTPYVLLVAGVTVVGPQRAVLEVLRRPTDEPQDEDAAGDLSFVALAAEFVADYVRAGRLADERRARQRHRREAAFIQQIYASLDPQRVCMTVANDGARLIACDRVTVLVRCRGRYVAAALSGQPAPDRRANDVRLMEAFAQRVAQNPELVVCDASMLNCPEAVEGSLKAVMASTGSKALLAAPLADEDSSRPPLGVIVLEQFNERLSAESLAEAASFLTIHTTAALRKAVTHDRVFLRSTRTRIGRWLASSAWVKRLALAAVVIGAAVALGIIPWDMRMPGRGTLRAEDRRGIFATEAGTVRQVLVDHGAQVHVGQPIVVLENHDLVAEHQQVWEELIGVEQQMKLAAAERMERGLPQLRQIQLDGEIAELNERATYLHRREELLSERLAELTLRSPIDGTVATWNPRQQLLDRPVQAGNLLVQVIVEEGPWRLDLQVADADSGHVLLAWAGRDAGLRGLPVDYILATRPERRYRGWLVDIAPRTELVAGEHVLRVTVEPDESDPPPLRDGAEVRGKIHCGRRSAGFVALREVIEFVQAHLLF
jgi:multidrug efflux pump subunit AcrA (membrane-fusion protein)